MFYTMVFYFVKPLFRLFYRLEIRGRENLVADSALYAANHKSYLDPVLVGYAAYPKRLHYMAKAELWKIPVLAQTITALNAFPVDRGGFGRKTLVRALDLLRNGENVLMFPEGTRIRKTGLGESRPGIAAIAIKTKTKIVPVGITGTEKVLPEGRKVPRFPKIIVSFGKPLDPAEYNNDQDVIMRVVMGEIGRLIGLKSYDQGGEGATP